MVQHWCKPMGIIYTLYWPLYWNQILAAHLNATGASVVNATGSSVMNQASKNWNSSTSAIFNFKLSIFMAVKCLARPGSSREVLFVVACICYYVCNSVCLFGYGHSPCTASLLGHCRKQQGKWRPSSLR